MNLEQARFNMVEQQIRPCDVHNQAILDLLFSIKREKFVPSEYVNVAFSDVEIPLPGGQKMFSPRIEALLLQNLMVEKKHKVLEIGTGSGFLTAILSKLADFVYSVEANELNQKLAIDNLTKSGITNVSIIGANGLNGVADKAPYDRILVGGGLKHVSEALKAQLKVGGRLIAIVGNRPVMDVIAIDRISESKYVQTKLFESDVEYLISENVHSFKF